MVFAPALEKKLYIFQWSVLKTSMKLQISKSKVWSFKFYSRAKNGNIPFPSTWHSQLWFFSPLKYKLILQMLNSETPQYKQDTRAICSVKRMWIKSLFLLPVVYTPASTPQQEDLPISYWISWFWLYVHCLILLVGGGISPACRVLLDIKNFKLVRNLNFGIWSFINVFRADYW